MNVNKILLILAIGLSFLACNLRADDSSQNSDPDGVLQKTPDDLSPADKEAARQLQNQIDEDKRVASQHARDQQSNGGDPTGLILIAVIVFGGIGVFFYSTSKVAGHIYVGCVASFIVLIAILAMTEKPPPPIQPVIQVEVAKPSPQDAVDAKAAESESLTNELVASEEALTKKFQRLDYVKQQVTHFWQLYQADSTTFNPATGAYDKRTDYQTDFDGKGIDGSNQYYYEKWLDDYQTESDELVQLKKNVIAVLQKMGLSDEGGIDPSTGLPAIDFSTGLPINYQK
jgi:hypothetical protein